MQVALAGTGVRLSDGATNIMPVPTHRGKTLTDDQRHENRAAVFSAWRLHADDVRHSLVNGFYQGWDLHPAQLPTRYGAVYGFFLDGFAAASERLRNFVDKAAQATLVGDVFDDAATGVRATCSTTSCAASPCRCRPGRTKPSRPASRSTRSAASPSARSWPPAAPRSPRPPRPLRPDRIISLRARRSSVEEALTADVAQLVEHQVVVLGVVGSTPSFARKFPDG